MKNNTILKLYRLAIFAPVVLLLLLLSSCQQDESYGNQSSRGSTLVNLSVSASNSDVAPASGDPASVISSICILQFNVNGTDFGTLRHVAKGTPSGTGKFNVRLLQSNGEEMYKLVVLANLPDKSYSTLFGMINSSYENVQSGLTSDISDSKLDFNALTPFPMFGIVKNGEPQKITESPNFSGTISLVRAVARVDIGIGKMNSDNTWNKNGVKFDMTQVQIWKAGKQYAYMPLKNNFSSSGGTLTISAPSPVGQVGQARIYNNTDITNNTYCSGKIYLPEADLRWGNVFDPSHTSRLAVIVGGKYNSSQKETFYRVDFTRDDNSREKMNILRNRVYQFTINKVTDDGYDTAAEAYSGKPQGLTFGTSIDAWKPGKTNVTPTLQEGYLMVYGGQNGSVTSGGGVRILKKSTYWEGENNSELAEVDYNTFYGEVPGNLQRSPAYPNGDIYSDIQTLTAVEGVYPFLMVATDDTYDIGGSSVVYWKSADGLQFTAFDMCRSYSGLGYSDWRLPRGSELFLMYLNRDKLEKQRGFTAFAEDKPYWSASEKGNPKDPVAEEAWAVNFASGGITYGKKTGHRYKIRCVRQISDSKTIEP